MRVVFFVGNGASMPEGTPSNDELLQKALSTGKNVKPINELKKFLDALFPSQKTTKDSLRPRFEDVLTFVDLALRRQESLSDAYDVEALQKVREELLFALCRTLDRCLRRPLKDLHSQFLRKLHSNGSLAPGTTSFLTTNYDILLDNAMLSYWGGGVDVDYALGFRNEGRDWKAPNRARGVHILKLHGSLNWLLCTACNTVKITPARKGVTRIWTDFSTCEIDDTLQRPLIVPPSHQKVMESPHLSRIWLEAENDLRRADRVIFVGYALSEADSHVRYLLKRGIHGRNHRPEILVIGRTSQNGRSETKDRYRRLFGAVEWQPIGFEGFVERLEDFMVPKVAS